MVDFPRLTNAILGHHFRSARLASTPQLNQAMERGRRPQGVGGLGWAAVKAQCRNGLPRKKIKVIAQFGFTRSRELRDVP